MILHDRLYGNFNITSPAIVELIASSTVQRLKKISQFGPPDKYYHILNYSRYIHSIGVMLLLKKLGGNEEELIAGLLHDVSHTAFSHLIDWVFNTRQKENYQDKHHTAYVMNSEIPAILKKYGFDTTRIITYKLFPLLEQNIPYLCADRIDYSVREMPFSTAKKCISDLCVYQNKITFRSIDTAYLFARNFLLRQKDHWGGYEAVTRYTLFSSALRLALKEGLINAGDFMGDEEALIKKLEKSTHNKIQKILSVLTLRNLSHLPKSRKQFRKKFRYIDPYILLGKRLVNLSTVNKKFGKEITKAKNENKYGIHSGTIEL